MLGSIDADVAFLRRNWISDTGNLVKLGGGTLTLTGTNIYNGTTTVNAGVLQAGSSGAFNAGSEFIVNAGATLDLADFSNTIGSLSGTGTVVNNGFGATLSVGNDNTNSVFSGVLANGTSPETRTSWRSPKWVLAR
jgi:autotransporter-associated beta strand protein